LKLFPQVGQVSGASPLKLEIFYKAFLFLIKFASRIENLRVNTLMFQELSMGVKGFITIKALVSNSFEMDLLMAA